MKTEFKYLWPFLLTCVYFRVQPSEVSKFHPKKEMSRIKQIANYMIWKAGASHRECGEITGVTSGTARTSCLNVLEWAKNPNSKQYQDIKSLVTILNLKK